MTKDELAAEIEVRIKRSTPDLGVTTKVAKAVIDALMDGVTDAVADGETVYLRGFGSFGPKLRRAKIARNISAGTAMEIPAHYIPEFTPCDEFRRVVRDSMKVDTLTTTNDAVS